MLKSLGLIQGKELIHRESFKEQHRAHPTDFTRDRKLSFPLLITLLLQKGVKSMQLLLNEMSLHLGVTPVSHSALVREECSSNIPLLLNSIRKQWLR